MPEFDHNALYIWLVYAIGAAGLGGAVLLTALRTAARKRKLAKMEKAQP